MGRFLSLAFSTFFFLGTGTSFAQIHSMQGTFVLVVQQSDDVAEAIERCISTMNFLLRPIAKHRLTKTNKPYQRITIELPPGRIAITTDSRAPILTSADGTPVKWKREDGEIMDVSTKWESKVLRQTFQAEDGKRVNSYELGPEGHELFLRVTVTSERLKRPLVYRLVYRRI
jgi:hypothetical protein